MEKKHVVGIDVGTSAIKVLAGTTTSEGPVSFTNSSAIPTKGLDKGVITDIHDLAATIKQAVDCVAVEGNVCLSNLYVGIGGVAVDSINCIGTIAPSSPKGITSGDIERACRAAALTGVPEDRLVVHALPVSFRVDGNEQILAPLAFQGERLDVETHLVTLPKHIVDELTDSLTYKGLKISGIVANAVVGAVAVLPEEGERNYLVFDMGAGTTDIVLYRDRQICLTASLPLGGDYITGDIMQGAGVTWDHAEAIKRYYARLDKDLGGQDVVLDCNDFGTTDVNIAYDFLRDIVECRVEEIVSLIHDYLKEPLGQGDVEKIFLTGGCSAMPSVMDCIAKVFQAPVSILNLEKLPVEYNFPGHAACYGIAAHAARYGSQIDNSKDDSVFDKIKRLFVR